MKTKMCLASLALALPAFAGSAAQQSTICPPPQPSLWSWFVGGSVGYLTDAQEAMYNGHIGVNTPWNVGGWNIALFGEVGYSEIKDSFQTTYALTTLTSVSNGLAYGIVNVDTKTDILPITFNIKFERPIAENLHVYVGAGLGGAEVDVSTSSTLAIANYSHHETVFTSQVFAGLNYKLCSAFEVYGGARWIYLSDAKTANTNAGLNNNDCLFELGARVTF